MLQGHALVIGILYAIRAFKKERPAESFEECGPPIIQMPLEFLEAHKKNYQLQVELQGVYVKPESTTRCCPKREFLLIELKKNRASLGYSTEETDVRSFEIIFNELLTLLGDEEPIRQSVKNMLKEYLEYESARGSISQGFVGDGRLKEIYEKLVRHIEIVMRIKRNA